MAAQPYGAVGDFSAAAARQAGEALGMTEAAAVPELDSRPTERGAQLVRTLLILKDLSRFVAMDIYELAERYGVNTRTIRRDVMARRPVRRQRQVSQEQQTVETTVPSNDSEFLQSEGGIY